MTSYLLYSLYGLLVEKYSTFIYLLTTIIRPSTLKITNRLFTDDIITVYELLSALRFNCNNTYSYI